MAQQANVEILHEDHCFCKPNTSILCSSIGGVTCPGAVYEPVCGVNGITYFNLCRSFGSIIPGNTNICCSAKIQCVGECPCCPDDFSPVCGVDGLTYQNSCHARGVQIMCAGQCPCHVNVHVCYRVCFGLCFTIC